MAENPVKETPERQAAPKQDTTPAQEAPKKEDPKPSSVNNPPVKEELPKQEPEKVTPSKEEKPAPETEKPTPTPVKMEKAPVEKPEPATKKVYIGVQIGACTDIQKEDEKFKSVEGLKRIKGTDGYTRFVAGSYTSISAAKARQNQLKAAGFKDCFLTAYDGDKKITPQEAEQLLKRP
jgi:cell division protein FtsN